MTLLEASVGSMTLCKAVYDATYEAPLGSITIYDNLLGWVMLYGKL